MTTTVNHLPKLMVITPAVQLFKAVRTRLSKTKVNYKTMSRARTDAAILRGMSDRELMDIGITRGDINKVCFEHAAKAVNANLVGFV